MDLDIFCLALHASQRLMDHEIEGMAKQYGLEADKVKEMIGAQNIKMIAGDIRLKKAIDFIYDNAVKK